MFPEIDTSFLGDAGPLPITVKPHWSQHIGKVILVRETYSQSKETSVSHIGPVILMKVDTRSGKLTLQRVLAKETFSPVRQVQKVGSPYNIECRDCLFIADFSHLVK
jgi:hypothetical protein